MTAMGLWRAMCDALTQRNAWQRVVSKGKCAGGRNVVTGSPISDINPLYMAAGSVFTISGEGTPTREVGRRPSNPTWGPFCLSSHVHAADPISALLPRLCSGSP